MPSHERRTHTDGLLYIVTWEMADAAIPAFPTGRNAAAGATAPKPSPRGARSSAVVAVLLVLTAGDSIVRVPHALAAQDNTERARETQYPFGYCEAAKPTPDEYLPHPTYSLAMAQVYSTLACSRRLAITEATPFIGISC